MEFNLPEDRCLKLAELEGESTVSAGVETFKMTAPQKLIQLILLKCIPYAEQNGVKLEIDFSDPEKFESDFWAGEYSRWSGDMKNEVRESGVETGLKCEWSRHYESEAVAAQAADGSWIGWTYWSGGGKHGEPEAIDWIGDAYDLDCKEEKKLMIVRTFKKKENL